MQVITIEKLERPEHGGDWHDKPIRWIVKGPSDEAQKFSTKKDATLYAKIRRASNSFREASHKYIDAV
jgi:hypothetical protein